MYNTSVNNNLQDLKPGALVKLQGTVASDKAFTALWNGRAVVYENQIYVKAGGRDQVRETVLNKLVPFWIETDGGRVRVQPSNKFGARDLLMVREAGTNHHTTAKLIQNGATVTICGRLRQSDSGLILQGSFLNRLVISDFAEPDLNPNQLVEFWLYLAALFVFISECLILTVFIWRYRIKLRRNNYENPISP